MLRELASGVDQFMDIEDRSDRVASCSAPMLRGPRTAVLGSDDPAESKSRLRALNCLLRHFAQKQGENGGPRAQVYEERFSPSQTVGPTAGMRK